MPSSSRRSNPECGEDMIFRRSMPTVSDLLRELRSSGFAERGKNPIRNSASADIQPISALFCSILVKCRVLTRTAPEGRHSGQAARAGDQIGILSLLPGGIFTRVEDLAFDDEFCWTK